MASVALLALAASGVSALSNSIGTAHGIPVDSQISYDGIYLGFAPDWDPQVTASYWKGWTGQNVATYNVYSQLHQYNVDDSSYSGNDQFPVQDIIDSKAVLIASLMPEIQWTDVTTPLCQSVNDYFTNTFTSQGTTVWLRFAHEMNWYASEQGGYVYPGGENTAEFAQAWECMYEATKDNGDIHMFWSPNRASNDNIKPWLVPSEQIDIVGMDAYPDTSTEGVPSFATVYGDFYTEFAQGLNKPFALGETGIQYDSTTSAGISDREAWLKNIINDGNYGDFPLYFSATWFEYGTEDGPDNIDYYIVYDQGAQVVSETISNTENGS